MPTTEAKKVRMDQTGSWESFEFELEFDIEHASPVATSTDDPEDRGRMGTTSRKRFLDDDLPLDGACARTASRFKKRVRCPQASTTASGGCCVVSGTVESTASASQIQICARHRFQTLSCLRARSNRTEDTTRSVTGRRVHRRTGVDKDASVADMMQCV